MSIEEEKVSRSEKVISWAALGSEEVVTAQGAGRATSRKVLPGLREALSQLIQELTFHHPCGWTWKRVSLGLKSQLANAKLRLPRYRSCSSITPVAPAQSRQVLQKITTKQT